MADAATATAPAPAASPPASSGVTGDPLSDKILGIEAQNVGTATKRLEESEGREAEALGKIEKTTEGLKPPTFTPPPQPKVQQTNPVQAWGSAAMMFALLGSAFSRTHLTTAFNAAASALEAFRKGDVENANAAFKQWQITSEMAMKQADFEMDRYNAIMGDVSRREKLVSDVGSQEQANILAELKATGSALGDELMARTRSIHEANQLLIERLRIKEQMLTQGAEITKNFNFTQAMKEWEADYTSKHGKPPTFQERVEEQGKLLNDQNHQWTDQQVSTLIQGSNQRAAMFAQKLGYTGAEANVHGVLEMNADSPPDNKTVIEQGQALDKFIQTINGNRAIRGFQLDLLRNDAGLYNKFQIQMQNLVGHGGPVSPDMIKGMQQLARDAMHVLTLQYGEYITQEQWQHHKHHLDATEFTPPDYLPGLDPGRKLYPEPPAVSVAKLKAHDTMDYWVAFDQMYGQGAAAQVFSSGDDEGG